MLIRLQPFALQLRDSEGRPMGSGRAAGLHLGDVIKHMRINMLGEKLDGKGGTVQMAAGFILEVMFERAFALYLGYQRPVVRPSEVIVDGIAMNADGINVEDTFLEDYKATWKSLKKLGAIPQCGCPTHDCPHWVPETPELRKHFWHWLVQLKSYARAYGTLRARLLILWMMGDYTYKPPFGEPHITTLEFEFTQEELDDNWSMVTGYARERLGLADAA